MQKIKKSCRCPDWVLPLIIDQKRKKDCYRHHQKDLKELHANSKGAAQMGRQTRVMLNQ